MPKNAEFADDVVKALRDAKIIGVRAGAKPTQSARLREAVTVALGQKYNTKASSKWVEGFGEPARELTTLELVPR